MFNPVEGLKLGLWNMLARANHFAFRQRLVHNMYDYVTQQRGTVQSAILLRRLGLRRFLSLRLLPVNDVATQSISKTTPTSTGNERKKETHNGKYG